THIVDLLRHAEASGLLVKGLAYYVQRLRVTDDYNDIAVCAFVQECVIEDKEIKKTVYQKIAAHVQQHTIIASNTSAIPISELQDFVPTPGRFVGVHWAEPAYMTRFMEVTCGTAT